MRRAARDGRGARGAAPAGDRRHHGPALDGGVLYLQRRQAQSAADAAALAGAYTMYNTSNFTQAQSRGRRDRHSQNGFTITSANVTQPKSGQVAVTVTSSAAAVLQRPVGHGEPVDLRRRHGPDELGLVGHDALLDGRRDPARRVRLGEPLAGRQRQDHRVRGDPGELEQLDRRERQQCRHDLVPAQHRRRLHDQQRRHPDRARSDRGRLRRRSRCRRSRRRASRLATIDAPLQIPRLGLVHHAARPVHGQRLARQRRDLHDAARALLLPGGQLHRRQRGHAHRARGVTIYIDNTNVSGTSSPGSISFQGGTTTTLSAPARPRTGRSRAWSTCRPGARRTSPSFANGTNVNLTGHLLRRPAAPLSFAGGNLSNFASQVVVDSMNLSNDAQITISYSSSKVAAQASGYNYPVALVQ